MARIRTNIEIEELYVRTIMDRYGIHTKTEAGTPSARCPPTLRRRRRDPRRLFGLGRVLRRLLLRCDVLAFEPAADFEAAARISRRCRRSGVTPPAMVDCLIASVARRHDATPLAQDADLTGWRRSSAWVSTASLVA